MKNLINSILLAALSCASIPAFGMNRHQAVAQLSKAHGFQAQRLAKTSHSAQWLAEMQAQEQARLEHEVAVQRMLNAPASAASTANTITATAARTINGLAEAMVGEATTQSTQEQPVAAPVSTETVSAPAASATSIVAAQEQAVMAAQSNRAALVEKVKSAVSTTAQGAASLAANIAAPAVLIAIQALGALTVYRALNPTVYPTCYLLAGHSLGCW